MSHLDRPPKQGNTTTYQAKVAAGYTTILASEVDADLDLIYSAWNQGVDTVNIKDGSITGSKLAPGAVGSREIADGSIQTADMGAGQVTTPILADGAVTDAKVTSVSWSKISGGAAPFGLPMDPRFTVAAQTGFGDLECNTTTTTSFDNTKPSWIVRTDYTGDAFTIFRAPPPGTAFVPLFTVDAAGITTGKARASGALIASAMVISSGAQGAVPFTVPWVDSGGLFSASVGGFISPAFDAWCMLSTLFSIDRTGSFGFDIDIQENVSGTWTAIASLAAMTQTTNLRLNALHPISANTQLRVFVTNATGGTVTVSVAQFTMAVLGRSS